MYKYETTVDIYNDKFGVPDVYKICLMPNTEFEILKCRYTYIKKAGLDSYFLISYYTQEDNLNKAEKIIKDSLNLIIFLTNVPFSSEGIRKCEVNLIPNIRNNRSAKKVKAIALLNEELSQIRKKRGMFENCMKLYATGVQFLYTDSFLEESFMCFFKIVEIIAKDEYRLSNNRNCKRNSKSIILNMLPKVLSCYGVMYPENKLDELAGEISNKIYTKVFDEIYAKIAWTCTHYGIRYDFKMLKEMVKSRNTFAHGENANMDLDKCGKVLDLAKKFVKKKFFDEKHMPELTTEKTPIM